MKITKSLERWFPAPDDPDQSEHLVRHLSPGEVADIIKRVTTYETRYTSDPDHPGKLTPEMIQKTDPEEIQKKMFLARLRGWKNMFDFDGTTRLECTEANKLKAYREIEGYAGFIEECGDTLKADILNEGKVLEKN